MLKIKEVLCGGIAEELGISGTDCVLQFNGLDAADILDYIYYDNQTQFVMTVLSNGEEIDFEIEKDEFESLGITFHDELDTIPCKNNCIFCFVSQLPKGMRETLYVKDDDWRLSLISGNYITLTNLDEKSLQRIIDMRISPLYISVHATDSIVRQFILKNPNADKIMDNLNRLSCAGINMNCQIVLCPNINDGEILRKTLEDLKSVERVKSVAVVPVGLTKYREKLTHILPVNQSVARASIAICDEFNSDGFEVLCSDEMYQIANMNVKSYEEYGDFNQIENGVGLIAKFIYEIENAEYNNLNLCREVSLATGVSGYPTMRRVKEFIEHKAKGIKINIYTVNNDLFGRAITVTGLLTGQDLIAQLKGKNFGEFLMLPRVMLREFEDVFLDNISLAAVEKELGVKIKIHDVLGQSFVDSLFSQV